jgi:hypothetical protein
MYTPQVLVFLTFKHLEILTNQSIILELEIEPILPFKEFTYLLIQKFITIQATEFVPLHTIKEILKLNSNLSAKALLKTLLFLT